MPTKKIALIISAFLFTSTLFVPTASAQDVPVIHYGDGPCPTSVTPNGKFNRPVGIKGDSLDIIVDPAFQAMMKKTRSTPDLPLTPIYDLIIQVVPQFGFCYTDKPESYSTVPPSGLPWKVSIQLDNEILVGPGAFTWNGKYVMNPDGTNDTTQPIYEWKIPGWPEGITKKEKLEKLIAAIRYNIPVNMVVEVPQEDGTFENASAQAPFGLCAPIGGSGKFKVVSARGTSTKLSVNGILNLGDKLRTKGFGNTEPFTSNQSYFSHLIDLGNYSENGRSMNTIKRKNGSEVKYFDNPSFFEEYSSCGDARLYIFYSNIMSTSVAILSGKDINMNISEVSAKIQTGTVIDDKVANITMHEIGHAFAGLNDEYLRGDNLETELAASYFMTDYGSNCVLAPINYSYDKKNYGSQNITGCAYKALNGIPIYRPSQHSLMLGGYRSSTEKFNVVSCGYIMAAIHEDPNARKYFPDCWKLSGLEDTGVDYGLAEQKATESTVSSKNGDTNVAAAISGIPKNHSFIMLDNFDPEDQWGAMIEIDENMIPVRPFKDIDSSPLESPTPKIPTKIAQQSFFQKIRGYISSSVSSIIETVTGVPAITPRINLTSPSPLPIISPFNRPSPTPSLTPKPSFVPIPSNSPTIIPLSSKTPTSSYSPSISPKPSPSATPINSPSPIPSQSPSTSVSPVPYQTPIQSNSVAPSNTPSPTASVYSSPTPTNSPYPSILPNTSPSPTPSFSPTPTYSPVPSYSPSPSQSPSAFKIDFNQSLLGNIISAFWVPWVISR